MMSLMKKIVKTGPDDEAGSSTNSNEQASSGRIIRGPASSMKTNPGVAIGKLKQTITSGIQDSVTAGMKSLSTASLASRRPSDKEISHLTQEEKSILKRVWEKEEKFVEEEVLRVKKQDKRKDSSCAESQNCRICRRRLSGPEADVVPYQTCSECGCRICDDCGSYSNTKSHQSSGGQWKCSLCRRKQLDQAADNLLGIEPGMHRVPSMRRMAVKQKQDFKEAELPKQEPKIDKQHVTAGGVEKRLLADEKESGNVRRGSDSQVNKRPQSSGQKLEPSQPERPGRRLSEGSCMVQQSQPNVEKWSDRVQSSSNRQGGAESEKWNDRAGYGRPNVDPKRHQIPKQRPQEISGYKSGSYAPRSGTGSHQTSGVRSAISSASESSLEDQHHYREFREDTEGWRRRRSRVRRKSRIQRQKNYDEDPDSDPTNNASNFAYHSRNSSSRDSWDSLDAVEYERDHGIRYPDIGRGQRNLLDVPSHRGDGSSSPNKYSSGSCSDVSDLSADFSSVSSFPPSPHNPGRTRRLPRHLSPRPSDLSDTTETTYYDCPLFDSSPSPDPYSEDRQFGYRYSQSSTTKSSSVEDTIFGDSLYAPSSNTGPRRSIPNLDIKDIQNQLCTRSWSYNFETDHDDKQDNDASYGRSLPVITVEDTRHSPSGTKSHHGHDNARSRRSTSPTATSRSLNVLSDDKSPFSGRRSTLADCENIKIIVHDVDANSPNRGSAPKRVMLCRNPEDRGHRTRGLGMRIVGGKIGPDGSLFAYVVWTVAGGPANQVGIKQGDKILEWDGISLVDKTFEDVCAIMDRSGDRVELVIDPVQDGMTQDMGDVTEFRGQSKQRRGIESSDSDWSYPSSPTRRRLPKIPPMDATSGPVTGELGVQIYYDAQLEQLTVRTISARKLLRRKSSMDNLPEAFVKLRLLPIHLHGCRAVKTSVSKPSVEPYWNKTFIYTEILPDEILDKTVELSVWDKAPDSAQSVFLGEVKIDLENSDLHDHLIWYKLTPKPPSSTLFSPVSSSVPVSPVLNYPSLQNTRKSLSKSLSDDQGDLYFDEDEIPNGLIKSPSVDFHLNRKNEDWDNRDYQQRLSSTPNLSSEYQREAGYFSERNTSYQPLIDEVSQAHNRNGSYKDQRQVWSDSERGDSHGKLKKKLSQKVKDKLAKTLILTRSDPKRLISLGTKDVSKSISNRSSQSDIVDDQVHSEGSSAEEDAASNEGPEGQENIEPRLGTGQVQPKDYGLDSQMGYIQLSIILVKGNLEVNVIKAQKLRTDTLGQPPDTYVKTYLRESGKHLQKRKTRVVRRKFNPKYNQTLRYVGSEAIGKDLVVMVWQRSKHLEHNKGIGVTQIELEALRLNTLTKDWFILFPMKSVVCVDNG